ncbi:MAG TPA: peroxiredoxin [Granulicella sp.]|jgi:peroxiredoxin Q/BCP|nr:peroxiredoxin [Granulicella sp.]
MIRFGIRAASTIPALFLFALTAASVSAPRAWAAEIAVGSTAPAFTLPSQEETPVSLSSYKGKWVVLYFYPKDMTSGCTLEAHNFQRDLPKYDALNAVVLGVSLDTVESHKTFCSKDSLTFKLLADPDHKVIDAYGIPMRTMPAKADGSPAMSFAKRETVLISPKGKVVKVWTDVNPANHSDQVLSALEEAKK